MAPLPLASTPILPDVRYVSLAPGVGEALLTAIRIIGFQFGTQPSVIYQHPRALTEAPD